MFVFEVSSVLKRFNTANIILYVYYACVTFLRDFPMCVDLFLYVQCWIFLNKYFTKKI